MEPHKYDIVMMNGVLHHLSDAQVDLCMRSIETLLKPGGRFCSFDGVYDEKISPLERLVLGNDRGKFVRTPEQYAAAIRKYIPGANYTIKRGMTRIPNPLIFFY
jgi:SAM-dependent methyltransferase